MTKTDILSILNNNPAFHLATVEGDQPHVRGMLLFKADENGIVFHTANTKDLFKQIEINNKVELCFNSPEMQVRITGKLEIDTDDELRKEIFNHPTRAFLRAWEQMGIADLLTVFRLKNGVATTWTMATNFDKKEFIEL